MHAVANWLRTGGNKWSMRTPATATLTCMLTVAAAGHGAIPTYLMAALFGASTFPIYSVSTAHGHDFASDDERVELSAAFMFLYAVGAIASPLIASWLIDAFGASAMFVFIALAHVLLVAFGLLRRRARPAPDSRTAYVNVPRTSFLVGRLFGRPRRE